MESTCRRRAPVTQEIVVLMAIGLDQPIGGPARDPRRRCTRRRQGRPAGRQLRPLCRRQALVPRRQWRTAIEVYLPPELELRPAPRREIRRAPCARLIVGLTLLVVTATVVPSAALAAAALASAALAATAAAGVALARWLRVYVDRELVQQWRFAVCTLTPCAAFFAWLWIWGLR